MTTYGEHGEPFLKPSRVYILYMRRIRKPRGEKPWRFGSESEKGTMPTKKLRETDLYPLVKAWLEQNGYTARGEVNGCDIAAVLDGELVLVEMKLAINLDLLLQLVGRQEVAETVYAAVPAPARRDKRWRGLTRLIKRLEAGLLLVHVESALPRVEVLFHPVRQERRRRKDATRAMLREVSGRSMDLNQGGGHRRPLVTAYREEALTVAAALGKLGPCAPKALRECGAPAKTAAILYANHYGWFERVAKGVYALTPTGTEALETYRVLVEKIEAARLKML